MSERTDIRSLVQQRGIVYEAIANETYPVEGLRVEQRPYRPIEIIGVEDEAIMGCTSRPKITVCGLAFDERPLTRATKQREMSLRVFVEQLVEPTNSNDVDTLIDLVEAVMKTCGSLSYWVRTETARDEHNMPFMFHVLREKSLFQGIFHPVYLVNAFR